VSDELDRFAQRNEMTRAQARRERDEGRAFVAGLLVGTGISVVIVLAVFLAVLLSL
jgi:hypothetical protein